MHQVQTGGGPLAALEARRGDYVLSIAEGAKILSISSRTLRRMIDAGNITAIRVSPRRRGVLASELARHMGVDAPTGNNPVRASNTKEQRCDE